MGDVGYKNILVIDDEPFILDIFSQFLSDEGFDIQAASSNDEAVTYIQNSKFDLILLDVHMKGLGFSDFISFLNEKDTNTRDIPVIAVTGFPDGISERDKSYLSAILEKPFTPDEMLACIRSIHF